MLNKVEHIVAKGEIAYHELFHLWPHCFKKASAVIAAKCVCMWKGLNKKYHSRNSLCNKQALDKGRVLWGKWRDYCLVFNATFNSLSVLSQCFFGKLPVLLVRLSWHQPVCRNAIPTTLSAKMASHYYHSTTRYITRRFTNMKRQH